MDTRHLEYFVAVAEELSFTRAADRMGIASPALSRAIAGLEQQLGVQLLERSTRRVRLTEPGEQLLRDARSALRSLDAAAARARRAAGTTGASLVLAVKADVEGGLLERLIPLYASEAPGVPLEIRFTGWGEQAGLVLSGEADAAIVMGPVEADGLDSEVVLEEGQVLAVPAGHALTDAGRLSLADVERDHAPVEAGSAIYVPRGSVRPDFADVTQMLRHIELGRMLALLPASFAERTSRARLAWVAVTDAPPVQFTLVWHRGSRSQSVAALVRVASDLRGDDLATRP